jgi:hypothetical protein
MTSEAGDLSQARAVYRMSEKKLFFVEEKLSEWCSHYTAPILSATSISSPPLAPKYLENMTKILIKNIPNTVLPSGNRV